MSADCAAARREQRQGVHDEIVLDSKLTAPSLPGWVVPRARISQRISHGARGPVTVITGPPGAGKTTALALWAAARTGTQPTAWVTLDRYDNRPESFWSHVREALRRCGVPLPESIQDASDVTEHRFLRQITAALDAQDPAVTLILDDLHLLTERRTLDGLEYVMRNARSGLHLVAASRADPQLALHKYRLAGEMTEIRDGDLTFTVSEASLLMAQHGIRLPRESVEQLTRRHEGWAAGLRMTALAMSEHPDPGHCVSEIDAEDRAIAGYLLDEVVSAQSVQAREVLLQTSILDRVSGELAADLTGDAQAGEVIAALARANTFIQPLGQGWYRYHWLFREVLRLKLRQEFSAKVTELHRRAAGWLWHHGTLTEAVAQAVQGGEWEMAARMAAAELAIGQLADPGAGAGLADWFRRMPADLEYREPPPALVLAALAARDLRHDDCAAWLADARRTMAVLAPEDQIRSRLAAAMIELTVARRSGDLDAAVTAAAQVEGVFGEIPDRTLARHPEVRAQVLTGRGAVELWAGHLDSAASLLGAGADADGNRDQATAVGHRALVEALRGRLGSAIDLATAATAPRATPATPGGSVCAAAEVALAWAQLERCQLDEARIGLSRATKALRGVPDKVTSSLACLVAVRHRLATGRPDSAPKLVSQARSGWSPPDWLERKLMLAQSHALAAAGDAKEALAIAKRAEPEGTLDGLVAMARAYLAAGDPEAAGQALAAASVAATASAPDRVRLEAQLLAAAACHHREDDTECRKQLLQSLKLAEPEHVRLPFAMERTWILPLLRHDPLLARAFQRVVGPGQAHYEGEWDRPSAVAADQLSGRELEVLHHVSSLESNAEIAAAMYLSIHTVKTHVRHILEKLGVQHRGEAVRIARQLQLL
jgi:LuxR family maltose regulon positive regulatory protein